MDNEIISFTTRDKRVGEVEGSDYQFITLDRFYELKRDGELIEYVEYSGNMYGITEGELKEKTGRGHAFCIVDYHGMKQMKEIYSNVSTIFLYTDYDVAKQQMIDRGDPVDKVEERLSTYDEELTHRHEYDYVIKNNNGRLHNTIEIIRHILESEIGASQ